MIGITGRSLTGKAPLGPWKLVALIVPATSKVAAGVEVLIPTRFSPPVYGLPRVSSDLTSITVVLSTFSSNVASAPPNSMAPLALSYWANVVYELPVVRILRLLVPNLNSAGSNPKTLLPAIVSDTDSVGADAL